MSYNFFLPSLNLPYKSLSPQSINYISGGVCVRETHQTIINQRENYANQPTK